MFICSTTCENCIDVIIYVQAVMAENADAIIALPGGFGTLEELTEDLAWQQYGTRKTKPVAFLNVEGFFDHFLKFVDRLITEVSDNT